MDELISRALDLAMVEGASYADIRLVNTDRESYVVRNGVVDTLSTSQSTGFGVRVVANGGWGFSSLWCLPLPEGRYAGHHKRTEQKRDG